MDKHANNVSIHKKVTREFLKFFEAISSFCCQWSAQNRKCDFLDEISFYARKNAGQKKRFAGKYEASDLQ